MKTIRRLLKAAAVAVLAAAIIESEAYEDMESLLMLLGGGAVVYFFLFKLLPGALFGSSRGGGAIRRAAGMHSRMIGGMERSVSGAVNGLIMGTGRPDSGREEARRRKQEADARARARWNAQNEAKFHEYYARKNAGTYDGYVSANKAQAARNRAKYL